MAIAFLLNLCYFVEEPFRFQFAAGLPDAYDVISWVAFLMPHFGKPVLQKNAVEELVVRRAVR
jgi:hypothetical protein